MVIHPPGGTLELLAPSDFGGNDNLFFPTASLPNIYNSNGVSFVDQNTTYYFNFATSGINTYAMYTGDEEQPPHISVTTQPLAACILKGTPINTPSGKVKIEELKIGDQILSFGKIHTIHEIYISSFTESSKLVELTPLDIHKETFYITQCHAMLYNGVWASPCRFGFRTLSYEDSLKIFEEKGISAGEALYHLKLFDDKNIKIRRELTIEVEGYEIESFSTEKL